MYNLAVASIFLSYRRTDGPQACRVHDWLARRFGSDAVFMDVTTIPFAVNFPDFIRQAIESSHLLIALIGAGWVAKIQQPDDPVRTELEVALASHIPVLPVLIGGTTMPVAEELPPSISAIASQNAPTIGVLHDFDSHMRSLLPRIEAILGTSAAQSVAASDPRIIMEACDGIARLLRERSPADPLMQCQWQVVGSRELGFLSSGAAVKLFLHRIARLEESLELHFILSVWCEYASMEHALAGWILNHFERSPVVPVEYFSWDDGPDLSLKVRASDEDARQIWKMITDAPLRLSLAYVATVSPKRTG